MQRSPLLIIFLTVFIDLVGFGIILPLLPYYGISLGASPLLIGLLSTSYSLMQFLFTPIWGRLSDRFGRRPLILLSLAGSCIGFFIFGLAHSLAMLFAARIVAGIAGAIIPTTYAYIADITSPEDRAKRMGMVGAAFGLGFILGPAIGGLLAPYGYDKPGFFASALAGCNLIFAYFKLPESLKPEIRKLARHRGLNLKAFLAALKHPQIGLLLVLVFVVSFAFSNMEATFGLLNQDVYGLDARHTGYLFTYIGILLGVIQGLLVGRLVRRVGERVCMSLGTLSMVLGLTLMPFAPNIPAYCGIIALIAVGNGINNPSMSSLLSRHSRIDEQGGIMGIAQSMGSLGRILGPIWGGFSYGTIGVRAPFVSAGVVMGIAFLLTLQNFRKQ